MAKRNTTTNPSASEPVFRIAHLFQDPVLQRTFGAAEDGLDGALALPAPRPSPRNDPAVVAAERELAEIAERIRANTLPSSDVATVRVRAHAYAWTRLALREIFRARRLSEVLPNT